MEHTLGACIFTDRNEKKVLILVLMEHTLGESGNYSLCKQGNSLNPCSNGTYSRSCFAEGLSKHAYWGLNPCSNGTYSRSVQLHPQEL